MSYMENLNLKQSELDFAARMVLMSAYLYYWRSESVLDDFENDRYKRRLYENWDDVPLRYKPLLDPDLVGHESLSAGTSHCKYTRMVESGAAAWLLAETGREILYHHPEDRRAHIFISGEELEKQMKVHELY